ncbi:MAG TPA: multiheme c-type cytochrome, partial [Kofleriaceae bacterium]|nr:multiheme c-type cytochrome [Kofleriaceae bacterium]
MRALAVLIGVAACGAAEPAPVSSSVSSGVASPVSSSVTSPVVSPWIWPARLPAAPGVFAPSLVAVDDPAPGAAHAASDGDMLSDVDSCATCHADAAAQWATSAHSFASFGNPIYRADVEQVRDALGKPASRHCAGCHDMPLMTDGLMTAAAPVPADDLRAHSGVTCRLCHAIERTTSDGNASYVWSRAPLDAPTLGDPASIARHRAQVSVKKLGSELCTGCHRGFLSADMDVPVHLTGLDEVGAWRNSAWSGNGMARIDKVENKTCLDCHMEREPASADEAGAHGGTIASHRFLGGHTWMAAMRGDGEHLRRLQAKLVGAASIDVEPAPGDGNGNAIDVVVRNLLVGHRFPGGVLDIQDTWVEVEVRDAHGARIAQSGLAHARDPHDDDAHVLRTLVVDAHGEVLEHHEMDKFRTQIATQTLAPREAQVIRYAFDRPITGLEGLTVTARLRHRSRTLQMQATVCETARTAAGQAFLAGAKGARDVVLDPCKAQPITLIAETTVALGAARPWDKQYEHGMALTATVSERLDEARAVLDAALAAVPAGDGRARAMVIVQLAQVAARQGRADDALALVAEARGLLPA